MGTFPPTSWFCRWSPSVVCASKTRHEAASRNKLKCARSFPRRDKWLSTRRHAVTPSTQHPHRQHSFREKWSRSIPEMDQCLWLGCCIRPFGEVTPIKRQLVREEAETLLAPRSACPVSSQSRGFDWSWDSIGREVVMSHQTAKKNRCCHTYVWEHGK